eukprot:CAMPEP_0204555460 /NCGR_PEP_ID=MMETSP0661-20131031/28852_1 /ASSEMBLY_ACC=CAM_ASM_000606 /TAXON_ID=109239 /ORGANISM="Alexandrium margalefi, Strain AMGDE01CS-322" /LENGTH=42 /DNA_ID= /DNA_START= /DNA_END= /DNA_ORIENTATION=
MEVMECISKPGFGGASAEQTTGAPFGGAQLPVREHAEERDAE